MKKILVLLTISIFLYSCYEEDPGPRQADNRTYAVVDFDRVQAGDALVVTISKGSSYSITSEGDRRNLDDLLVYKNGNTLEVKFSRYQRRQYTTYITITMPSLTGVNFSGAVNADVSGFTGTNKFDLSLSGASLAQLDLQATELHVSLSGASQLRIKGTGEILDGTISGASILSAFEFPINDALLLVSGASTGKISVSDNLDCTISGASMVLYRGNPQLTIEASGESVVKHD